VKNSVSSKEFNAVVANRRGLKINGLLFFFKLHPQPKISFIVSKRYGDATKRNLFKRRCKFLFSEFLGSGFPSIILIVRPLINNINFKQIRFSFTKLNDQFHV
tara:strand:+ start:2407 stop:2715 length:309 start_codon:yes stop_codon:yes gene_type:complete